MSPKEKDVVRRAVGELARCVMYAADPHVDCRDEMMSILDAIEDELREVLGEDLVDGKPAGNAHSSDPLKESFRKSWLYLADRGMCDAIDGAEYNRVWAEYCEMCERITNQTTFIRTRANIMPSNPPPQPDLDVNPADRKFYEG